MAALDDHRARAELDYFDRSLANRRVGIDSNARQHFGLGNIRRDDARDRNQPFSNRAFALRSDQQRAAARHDHRIDHRRRQFEPFDRARDRLDDRRVGERAGLDRARNAFQGERIELRLDHLRRHVFDVRNPETVLRDHFGDDGIAIDAKCGEGLEVGLQAGAAAWVAAGNR